MSVNGVVNDTFSAQQNAAGINQAAANELREIDKKDNDKDDKQVDNRPIAKKVIDSKSSDTASKAVLADLVANLAGAGVKLEPEMFIAKASHRAKDEYDLMLQNRESANDSVDLTTVNQRINATKKFNQQGQGKGDKGNNQEVVDPRKAAGTVEEFSSAFVQLIVSGGTDAKKKADRLEQQLRSEGLSDGEVLGVKNNLRQSVRSQLASQIKESFMKRFFNKEKTLDWLMSNKEGLKTIEFAFHSDKLGGWDFGGYNDSLQGTVDNGLREIRGEVRDFVNNELQTTLVKKQLGDPSADKDIKQLVDLGLKSGLNPQAFMARWQKTRDDLGLNPAPANAQNQSMLEFGMNSNNKNKEKTGYEYTKEEEQELFLNQLRTLYMQRAIRNDLKTKLETSFKIRKLKNGLIKLGVQFADYGNIEEEGKAMARVKLLDMLKEAFYEKATLYQLSGPAFNLVENKIKGAINNLSRLGWDMSKTELDSIRDQANFAMFDVTRNEFENTIVLYEANPAPYYSKKLSSMVKLMKRLKEESYITTDFDPEQRFSSHRSAA